MPIGIAPLFLPHGNISILQEMISKNLNADKQHLCYLNYSISHPERRAVYNLLKNKKFAGNIHSFKSHLKYIYQKWQFYKFAISLHGNGLDCHRTWEVLLVGLVPTAWALLSGIEILNLFINV